MGYLLPTLAAALVLACLPGPAGAQLPSVNKKEEPKAESAAAESPEQMRARLKGWIEDWHKQAQALESGAAPPPGITADELAARQSDLMLGIFTAENSIRSLDTAAMLQEALKKARESHGEWTGFPGSQPYSFVLHDEVRRQQESIVTRIAAYESAVAMLERELARRQDDIRKAEENLRRLQDALDRATPEEKDVARWRLEGARLRLKALGSSAGMLQLSRENTRLRAAAAGVEKELIDRKVAALGPVTAFPEEDLAQLRKSTEDRRKQLARELSAVEKTQATAVAARQSALAKLAALKAANPEPSDEIKRQIAGAEARVQSLENEIESMASRVEITGARLRFLGEYSDAQTSRRTLLTSDAAGERAAALLALQAQLARASAFDSLVEVRRNAALSAIQEQEARLGTLPEDSPQRAAVEKLMTTQRADLDAVERFGQDISSLRLDIQRWLADAGEVGKTRTWGERFRSIGQLLGALGKKIWNFEVYRYEDKTEVEGEVITVKRGLVLGWLLGALLFFYAAYRAGSWLLKRAFQRLVAVGRMEEGQAQTLRRWTRIAMAIVLALITLHLLKIPLTAFAFLGGALAIGVGFGTQTLFKNFISGILVLFERKVRVGDILDVDGVAGTVTSIDTRSSMIRTFDGVEIILPNSLLLENKVTNWTHDTPVVRRVVRVGVSYGSPLRQVSAILAECAAEHGVVAKNPEPQVILEDFGPDSLVFALYYWIDLRGKTGAMVVGSDLRFMIEKRLTDAGISIAFPQREIHLSADQPLRVEVAQTPER